MGDAEDPPAQTTAVDHAEAAAATGLGGREAPEIAIATEADLVNFTRLPLEERAFTPQLRGVLAESALTGCIRYKWPLLRPLVDFVLEQVLSAYDAETRVDIGPQGPDSASETIERFQKLLSAFSDAPWTFQRLCEILLEPKRQYTRLSKLVLAIEKCLLVTTEQPPTEPDQLPPLPLCSTLGPVNANPAPVYTSSQQHKEGSQGAGAGPSGGADDSGAGFTHSLLDVRHHPGGHHHHLGNHTGPPEHIEEDHWPEGRPEVKGAYKAAGAGVGLHSALRPGGGASGGSPGGGYAGILTGSGGSGGSSGGDSGAAQGVVGTGAAEAGPDGTANQQRHPASVLEQNGGPPPAEGDFIGPQRPGGGDGNHGAGPWAEGGDAMSVDSVSGAEELAAASAAPPSADAGAAELGGVGGLLVPLPVAEGPDVEMASVRPQGGEAGELQQPSAAAAAATGEPMTAGAVEVEPGALAAVAQKWAQQRATVAVEGAAGTPPPGG
ncbi:Serine/threonine-protein phosphatase 4 regulatory subunit 2 [Tetrabaena socialis]|uniref:Serine/threonine-protein phosphatase 4 regulatory subunit 2 n=1 Tax=Tetrabaena socialis TaxID=47790 RepID=A0A2J8ACC3_9CHLO|nr:Serine/threonine-protein phosphatase 4 regulatory subunit 2 [Tetrabaena socialis]|eukprot:PNH10175.1 Serine/threonine-protein phosphatase 4 regulatory subunit 2 [Tetrabaena socialis]